MTANAKELSRALLDNTRDMGIERGVDLVLNVLFVRWVTLRMLDVEKGAQSWSALVTASTDSDLINEFARLAIFQERERIPASEPQEYVGALRRTVHAVDAFLGSDRQSPRRRITADLFDATLDHLERLGKQAGEADTPRGLAELMVALTVGPGDNVLDPVCGNATGLVVAARHAPGVSVSGIDINQRVARRALMRLMVDDVDLGDGADVWCGDAFLEYVPRDADVVLAQPPWGATFTNHQRDRIRDLAVLYAAPGSPPGFPKGDMPWLLLALDALKGDEGRAAVVLSSSSVSARCRDTHEQLLALNAVEAVISLPAGVFRHTGIATTLWLLRAPARQRAADRVLMMDAASLVTPSEKGGVEITPEMNRLVESVVTAHRSGAAIDAPSHVARVVPLQEIDTGRGVHPHAFLDPAPEELVIHPEPDRTLLTHAELANFKAFGRKTLVPLAPLTLLYGANSAGKSSIIQSLLLLKQSRRGTHLNTQDALVNLGGFDGIVHRHQSADLELSLGYGVLPAWLPSEGTPDPTLPRTVTWVFSRDSSGHGALRRTVLRFGEYELPLRVDPDDLRAFRLNLVDVAEVFDGIATGTLLYPFDARHYTDGNDAEQARRLRGRINNARRALRTLEANGVDSMTVQAVGMLPTGRSAELRITSLGDRDAGVVNSYVNRAARLAGGMSEEINSLLDSLVWLGPLRSAPQRVYDRADTASSLGEGKHVAIYLFDHASVVEQVNDWLGRLEVPYTLDVIPVTATNAASLVGDLVAISLTDHRSGVSVTPADVGFGVSQVLPIVVELLSRRETIIAVEQPETHLHPRLQARLADLFIDTAQEGGRGNQLIIETHSEHLMLRVQRRIREGTLDASLASIVYVDQDADGLATATQLRLNDRGEFIDEWPNGFFDDRLEELFGEF